MDFMQKKAPLRKCISRSKKTKDCLLLAANSFAFGRFQYLHFSLRKAEAVVAFCVSRVSMLLPVPYSFVPASSLERRNSVALQHRNSDARPDRFSGNRSSFTSLRQPHHRITRKNEAEPLSANLKRRFAGRRADDLHMAFGTWTNMLPTSCVFVQFYATKVTSAETIANASPLHDWKRTIFHLLHRKPSRKKTPPYVKEQTISALYL